MFPAELSAHGDRRRARRAKVDASASLVGTGDWRAVCRVADLSEGGACLKLYSPVRIGARVWLRLPGLGLVAAQIMWSTGSLAGCKFEEPLREAAMNRLAETLGFTPAPAERIAGASSTPGSRRAAGRSEPRLPVAPLQRAAPRLHAS